MKTRSPSVLLLITLVAFVQVSRAIDNYKLNVTGALNVAARWSSNAIPGINTNAVWDSRVTSVGTNNVGGSMAWGGIRVSNAAVRVQIGQTTSMVLSVQDGGINMTNASNDFQIECNAIFTNSQSWNIPAGRTFFYSRQLDVGGNTTISITNSGTISGDAAGNCVIRVGTLSSGTSVINQSAGTIIGNQSGGANVLNIGKTAGSIGIYNLTGGTIDADDVSNDKIHIADLVGCDGRFNVSGGQVFAQVINVGNDGAGTLTLSGTATITLVGNMNVPNSAGSGVVNLDGGTLTVPKIAQASGPGTFNFNGGTLRPTGSRTDFLQGLATGNVKDNGARIDTAGFDITIAQVLQHAGVASTDGGLIKFSSGTLTLSGPNTYNGANQVNSGKLVLTTSQTGGGSITVADGAALGATVAAAGASLNTSSLILGSSAGTTSEFYLGTGNPTAPVINTTALETHGTVTVNVSGVGLSVGQFPLIKYTGSIAGSGFAAFSLGALPSGVAANLVNNTGNTSVDLNITAAPKLVWTAAANSNWDIQTTTNWLDSLSSTATYYSDGLPVLFDDTALSGGVQIVASVSPTLTTVSNNSLAYSFNGAGSIITGGLTKQGSGTLTLNTAQSYPGDTTVSAGTLALGISDTIPDGAGKGNVVVNGALDLAGFNETINGLSGNGTVNNSGGAPSLLTIGNNNVSSAFAGVIQNTGTALAVTKTGSGTLTLSGSSSYSGDTTISAGIVQVGNNNAFGLSTVRWNASTISSDGLSPRTIPNTFIVGANVTVGNVINSGPLTFSGPMSFVSAARTFTCNSDAILTGALSDGGLNKVGSANLTIKGSASLTVDSEVRIGSLILDGASVNSALDLRPDNNTVNGFARLILTNGATLTLASTTANLRAGFDGNATASNHIDAAGVITMPNADSSNGKCILGTGCKRGFLNLLPGGDVEAQSVVVASGREGEINFNGGTLRPKAATNSFIQVNDVNILNGGAVFDTSGFDITVAQKLQAAGTGGLTKNGNGTLTLTATNTYTGVTTVNGGKLVIPTAQTGGGALTVNDGASAQAKRSAANSSLTASTVTLGASTGAAIELNLAAFGNPTVPVINATTLATHGTITVNVSGAGLSPGQFVLIDYTGAIGGGGYGAFTLGTLPLGVTANLVNNTGNSSVDLQITAIAPVLWTGANNGDWDIAGTPNWQVNAVSTTYQEPAVPGPAVRFDDTATGSVNVNVTTVVSPASVTISNNSQVYSFGGSGKISGPASLTKQGTGSATFATANDYAGTTLVSGGTLALGASDVIPDGAGKGDLTVSSGATFDLPGFSDTVNGLSGSGTINASAGAGTLRIGSNNVSSTFSGSIQNSGGTLALQKVGGGTLTLTANNSYSGGTTIATGSVQAGHNNALGTGTITLSSGNLSSDSTTARTIGNNFVLTTASSLGDTVNNGLLTLAGSFDFGGAARNLTCNNDVIINGFMSNGSLNKEGENTTLRTTGNADFISGAEVHRGTWIINGTVTNTDSTRPDVNLAGRLARLVVTNGGAIVLTGTAVNGRVGFTGGDSTMTNVFDLAGSFRMPNAIGTADCEFTVGRNGSHGILNLYPGGDVQCRHLIRATTGIGNYGEVNFDGGIVRSTTNDSAFITGFDLLTVRSRGATIDSDIYTIGTGVPFQDGGGGGGLTKIGTGTFNMNGINTFTGLTLVSQGTLGGNGSFAGPMSVASGATLSPGTGLGALSVAGSLTLSNGSTTFIELNKSAATNDTLSGMSSVTYGGTLSVSNLAGTLAGGDSFKIFNAGSYNGAFASLTPATPGTGLAWDTTQLALSGTLGILSSMNTSRTNITVVALGGSLDLSWPADHTGWSLQSQTNTINAGLGTNWVTIPGTAGTNHVVLPVNPANGSVFFRLVYP